MTFYIYFTLFLKKKKKRPTRVIQHWSEIKKETQSWQAFRIRRRRDEHSRDIKIFLPGYEPLLGSFSFTQWREDFQELCRIALLFVTFDKSRTSFFHFLQTKKKKVGKFGKCAYISDISGVGTIRLRSESAPRSV